MSASITAVKSRTTQEQQKAAPLCFSFSTEKRVSSSGSTNLRDSLLVCFPFRLRNNKLSDSECSTLFVTLLTFYGSEAIEVNGLTWAGAVEVELP